MSDPGDAPFAVLRPKDLEERVTFLEGEVEFLQFMLATVMKRFGGEKYAKSLAYKGPEFNDLESHLNQYDKGYAHSYLRLREQLRKSTRHGG